MKFRFMRYKLTFAILIEVFGKRIMPIAQLSTKDPWWIPSVDTNWCGNCVLFGWLFFYVGWNKNPWDYSFERRK